MDTSAELIDDLLTECDKWFRPRGLEVRPFLTGWYNARMSKEYWLPYRDHTLAVSIIANPRFFERSFLEFVRCAEPEYLGRQNDLLDASVRSTVSECIERVSMATGARLDAPVFLQDSDMDSVTRRPRIVVRVAGHVSGQARYYQRADVPASRDPWGHRHDCSAATAATEGSSKIFGCSFHHEYGGWFAFRGVIIFPGVEYDQLEYRDPPDPLNSDPDLIIKLLNEFNFNWKTWRFRDLIEVKERYSRAFMNYLSLPPGKERRDLVKKWWHILRNSESNEIANFSIDGICNGGDLLDWGMR